MRQRRAETAEGEHGEGDQRLGGLEAKGATRDQSQLRVQALDAGVRQAMGERGLDPGHVLTDGPGQLDEPDAAAAGPVQPVLEQLHGLFQGQLEDQAELLLEEVRMVQGAVQLGQPGQARRLVVGDLCGYTHPRQVVTRQRRVLSLPLRSSRVVFFSLAYAIVRLVLEVLIVQGRANAELRAEVLALRH